MSSSWWTQAYRRAAATKDTVVARDIGLLVPRSALAWIFIWHGARTLFGAFGGPGIQKASIFYGTIAHLHPPTFFTVLGGSLELFGGIAVGLGLLGRLGAAGLVFDMVGAMVTVTLSNGLASDAPGGGYELTLALAALAFPIVMMGTGRLSLDVLMRRAWHRGDHASPSVEVGPERQPAHVHAS